MGKAVLRTPDACFADLPDYPFTPHYVTVADDRFGPLRMHYVDEGPIGAPVVLMLHGEPTWSFLYRKIIPIVANAGYRALAPDLIGFGRSDKLAQRADYSYQAFVDWVRQSVETLDLRRITLVCQDWGGPIALRVLSEMPERFDAVLATNTAFPNFDPPPLGVPNWPGEAIENWVGMCKAMDDMPVSEIIGGGCATRPSAEILRGYDAPFPDKSYKAGALAFPGLIPTAITMPGAMENRQAWRIFEKFDKPFLTAFSDKDPVTKDWETVFQHRVAGATGQPHCEIADAGHFVQEEQGEKLAGVVLDLLRRVYE